jgi:hypothetical protein
MNRALAFILTFAVAVSAADAITPDQVRAYASTQGFTGKLDVGGETPGRAVILRATPGGAIIMLWDVEGVAQPELADLPSEEDASAAVEAARQAAKSPLHKAADNALIRVLIRGALLPADATAVPAGTADAVTLQLLQAEVLDPDNATIQRLGSKLDKLRTIIRRQGGDPDDAVVHE